MIRTLISWLALILIPVISLGFAVTPYVWVKKRKQPVLWRHLWAAFLIGLVGNIGWWWVVLDLFPSKISFYIQGFESGGLAISSCIIVLFISATPFVFYKLKYNHLRIMQVVYTIILGIILLLLEISAIIYLFFSNLYRLMI